MSCFEISYGSFAIKMTDRDVTNFLRNKISNKTKQHSFDGLSCRP